MRLRLFRGRSWWPRRSRAGAPEAPRPSSPRPASQPGSHRRTAASESPAQTGISPQVSRNAGRGPSPVGAARGAGHRAGGNSGRAAPGAAARIAIRTEPAASRPRPGVQVAQGALVRQAPTQVSIAPAWYAEAARPGQTAAGRRDCGLLERVLVREWAIGQTPAPETVVAVNRLADLPVLIKEKLAAGLDAIHVGPGGVPDLDDMGDLKGVPLPSGRATWDACAGAYGDRKIIVGTRPSPTPDVMCHEVGHALDDLDGAVGEWQSDSVGFRALYGRCFAYLASEFHRHDGALGRREFFADAFAAIASGQRPALVEMLSGDTRTALDVMLYFNVRYGM
jgi:hypothetical protein